MSLPAFCIRPSTRVISGSNPTTASVITSDTKELNMSAVEGPFKERLAGMVSDRQESHSGTYIVVGMLAMQLF